MTLDEVVDAGRRRWSRRAHAVRLWGLPLAGTATAGSTRSAAGSSVPLFGGAYRCRARGADNLPASGPAIVIVNHKSNVDPRHHRHDLRPSARASWPRRSCSASGRSAGSSRTLGAFPIDRGAGDREALTTSLEVLARGEVLLDVPRGHTLRATTTSTTSCPASACWRCAAARRSCRWRWTARSGWCATAGRVCPRCGRWSGRPLDLSRHRGAQQQGLPGGGAPHAGGRERPV